MEIGTKFTMGARVQGEVVDISLIQCVHKPLIFHCHPLDHVF